jgi:hypothetical protein
MFNITDSNLSYILFSPESKDSSEEVNKKNCEKRPTLMKDSEKTTNNNTTTAKNIHCLKKQ